VIPLRLLVASLIGWLQRDQHEVIEYLREENWVLMSQLRNQRVRLTDDEGGAWLSLARGSVVGCWCRWRRLSRPTRSSVGTASSSPGSGRTRSADLDGPAYSWRFAV
jgi:hypothetical protein